MSTSRITCQIGTTDHTCPLGIEIWVDNDLILNCEHVKETIDFAHDISDDDGEHELRFIIKNKTQEHTKIDDNGNIISDARLTLKDVAFDEIALAQLFVDHAVYRHDFNGTGEPVDDKFFGELGCNGTLSLEFATPIYLWLLEHM